jgi:hypothetical protein
MRMDPIAEMLCREANPNLPPDWEIYAMEAIPFPAFTHVKVWGSVPSRFVRGKNKGEKKWCNPSQHLFCRNQN